MTFLLIKRLHLCLIAIVVNIAVNYPYLLIIFKTPPSRSQIFYRPIFCMFFRTNPLEILYRSHIFSQGLHIDLSIALLYCFYLYIHIKYLL